MLDQSFDDGDLDVSWTGSAMLDQLAKDKVDDEDDDDEDDLSWGGSAIDENLLGCSLGDGLLCFLAICRTMRETIALSAAISRA